MYVPPSVNHGRDREQPRPTPSESLASFMLKVWLPAAENAAYWHTCHTASHPRPRIQPSIHNDTRITRMQSPSDLSSEDSIKQENGRKAHWIWMCLPSLLKFSNPVSTGDATPGHYATLATATFQRLAPAGACTNTPTLQLQTSCHLLHHLPYPDDRLTSLTT